VSSDKNIKITPIKKDYNIKYLKQQPEFSALHSFFGHDSEPSILALILDTTLCQTIPRS